MSQDLEQKEKKERANRIVGGVIGFGMMAVSTPCVVAFMHDVFIAGTDNVMGATIVGIFCAFLAVAGAFLTYNSFKKPEEKPFVVSRELERRALEVARQHGGRLTVAEFAVGTELTLDECNAILQHLEQREAVRTHLSPEGDIVYVVPGFTVDKEAAIDPLNDAAVFDAELAEVAGESDDVVLEHPEEAKQENA